MPTAQPFVGSESTYTRQQLRARRFTRITRDVYLLGATADLTSRTQAAQLVLPGSVACRQTATMLQQLPGPETRTVHLARPGDAAWSVRSDVRVHRFSVRADEIVERDGVRLTDGPRTLADLAAVLTKEQLAAVGDVVLRRHGRAAVEEALRRAHGRPGVVLLRQVVPLLDPRAASPAETRARLRLHAAGFTALRHGVRILAEDGGWLAEADLGDPEAKVAVQYDGAHHFTLGERQRRQDVARDELSREHGWQVVVATREDDARPEQLLRRVSLAYQRAAQVHGRRFLPPHLR